MTNKKKRQWERSDTIALWAFIVSILSFISSVALPLWFRAQDRAEHSPRIEVSGTYLHQLTMANDSNLIERVAQSWNVSRALKEVDPISAPFFADHLFKGMDHRLFRIKIVNKRNDAVSIAHLKFADLVVSYPSNPDYRIIQNGSHLVAVSSDRTQIDPCPFINVGPNGSVVLDIINSSMVFPHGNSVKTLADETSAFLQVCSTNGVDSQRIRDTECFHVDAIQIIGACTNTIKWPIYYPLYERQYISQGKLKSARLAVTDQLGNSVLSSQLVNGIAW